MNRVRIILRENKTLHEMLLGLTLSNLVILIIGLIIASDKFFATLGVLEGYLVAVFYVIHMAVTLDDTMCLDEKGAVSQMRKHMMIRYALVCIVVAVVSQFKLGNPILCILSILTVKLGAYLQPLVHRILTRSEERSENGGKISE